MRLLVATTNSHKAKEIQAVLSDFCHSRPGSVIPAAPTAQHRWSKRPTGAQPSGAKAGIQSGVNSSGNLDSPVKPGNDRGLEIITLKQIRNFTPVIEDGKTFKENAVKKAVEYAKQSGFPTVADDSGLCVDALDGAPGVLSARFAGDEQNDLANCQKLLGLLAGVPKQRRSARFECHIAFAKPEGLIAIVSGNVKGFITEELRGKNGFGYDPLFLYPALNQTFAEISPDLKNRISHRAQALGAFKKVLSEYIQPEKKPLDN